MTSGVSRDRPRATEVCKTRGWLVGAFIASSDWECEREIMNIGPKFVTIRIIDRGSRCERVVTFPADVHFVAWLSGAPKGGDDGK